jgi:hypothetical protein
LEARIKWRSFRGRDLEVGRRAFRIFAPNDHPRTYSNGLSHILIQRPLSISKIKYTAKNPAEKNTLQKIRLKKIHCKKIRLKIRMKKYSAKKSG